MKLTPTIASPEDLYHKLEREMVRVFHSRNAIARADHFNNFCITAHAIRDHYFAKFNITQESKKCELHKRWNKRKEIGATKDIANTTKHFILRNPTKTRAVDSITSMIIEIYEKESGKVTPVPIFVKDFEVELSSGEKIPTYQFMKEVLSFWYREITFSGFQIAMQSDEDLHSI